jgi:hypothetical protein
LFGGGKQTDGPLRFYVAEMSRDDAEGLLVEYGRHIDGAFLFRKSRGFVVLSMCADAQLHHLKLEFAAPKKKVESRESALKLDRELFGFVKHYAKKTRGLLPHTLKQCVIATLSLTPPPTSSFVLTG